MAKSIVSYNVNGIRAAERKGLLEWLDRVNPDVVCIQETKARPEDVKKELFAPAGYHGFWHSAEKKGYSGVAIWAKEEPKHVEIGCGMEQYDREGRVIRVDFNDYSVISLYLPSGSSGDERQAFKDVFLVDFHAYIRELKQDIPNLVISGDYNIVHKAIDIHDPVSNKKSSGFLPHERQWVTDFLKLGFTDSFRALNEEADQYTWWSYRARSRERNKGWRIDYNMVSDGLAGKLKATKIYKDDQHSDHAALELILDL